MLSLAEIYAWRLMRFTVVSETTSTGSVAFVSSFIIEAATSSSVTSMTGLLATATATGAGGSTVSIRRRLGDRSGDTSGVDSFNFASCHG
jgi:hypothetical protein